MLDIAILCSNQRNPVANIEAIPIPIRLVPIYRTVLDSFANIPSNTDPARHRLKEDHMTKPGLAIIANNIARPLVAANVPQNTAATSEPENIKIYEYQNY